MDQIPMTDLLTAAQRAALTANELIYELRLVRDHIAAESPKSARKIAVINAAIAHLTVEVAAYNAMEALPQ